MLLQPSPSSVGPQDYQMSHHLTLLISLFPRKHCPVLLTNLTLTISLRTPRICGLGPSSSPLAFLMLVIGWGSFRLPIWASISWTASSVFAFNTSGDHALACGDNNDRVLRHNSLRDIFSAVQSAALSPHKEVPSLVPDSLSRPTDVYLPHWSHGRPAAVDVTVISPLQCHTLSQSASLQGYALSVAEKRKRAVHFEDCRRVGVSFLPLAVETLGGWSQDALVFLRAIGRHLASRFGLPPGEVSHHLLQRLSVTLWRFNAQMWLGHFPTLPSLVDGLV